MEKQFSLYIALDIKRWFNKAVSSYFVTSTVCIFIFVVSNVTVSNRLNARQSEIFQDRFTFLKKHQILLRYKNVVEKSLEPP